MACCAAKSSAAPRSRSWPTRPPSRGYSRSSRSHAHPRALRLRFGRQRRGLTPLMLMYTLGRNFVPHEIHAGGLRYHGDSPLVWQLPPRGAGRGHCRAAARDVRASLIFRQGHEPRESSLRRKPTTRIRAAIDEALACNSEPVSPRQSFSRSRATATSTWRPTTGHEDSISRRSDKGTGGTPQGRPSIFMSFAS